MTFRISGVAIVLVLATLPLRAADTPPYAVKVVEAAPPKDVTESIRKLLADKSVQLAADKGEVVMQLWFRKELPAKATEAQVKNGVTYREIPESTVVGAVNVVQAFTDYRKQKIQPGAYTLRLAFQPLTGDHMGTAPYSEFFLLCPAADDKGPDLLEVKALHELSIKTTGGHPGVWVLFPGKDAGDEPKLVNKGDGHWVLMYKQPILAADQKATMQIGLTIYGTSPNAP